MQKSLDTKLADIRQNPQSNAFIIAYAADSDMARGLATLDTRSRSGAEQLCCRREALAGGP